MVLPRPESSLCAHISGINIEFQVGIRENMGCKWFCRNNSWIITTLFCYPNLPNQIVGVPYAYNNNCRPRNFKNMECYTVKHYTGTLLKESFRGFYEIGVFTNKKWICYRNIQTHWLKLQRDHWRDNERPTILFFVGNLLGHARVLL